MQAHRSPESLRWNHTCSLLPNLPLSLTATSRLPSPRGAPPTSMVSPSFCSSPRYSRLCSTTTPQSPHIHCLQQYIKRCRTFAFVPRYHPPCPTPPERCLLIPPTSLQ